MSKLWTTKGNRLNLRQLWVAGFMAFSWSALAPQPELEGRKPANYVPNDDVIVVPVDAEMSFYERNFLYDEDSRTRNRFKEKIKIWQENELMAQRYGVDTQSAGSLYYVPADEEKLKWFQRSYFRYLQKKGEDPFKEEGQDVLDGWTANDEVDSIDEMESRFRASVRRDHGINKGTGVAPSLFREKQIAKTKEFRFNFQPRLEQGLVILRMTGPIVDARAWVAANGETEVNAERKFAATGTRFMVNYFAHSGRYLSSVDQNLMLPGLRARFTSTWDPDQLAPKRANERRYQLMYSKGF